MVVDHVGILIFTHDQLTIGRNDEVVAVVKLRGIGRFEEQLQAVTAGAGAEAENLAQLCRAARSAPSWLKRPSAVNGRGSTGPVAAAGTSNTQP